MLFDANGRANDLLFVDANAAAARLLGADWRGRRLREIDVDYESHWFELFGRVARSGRPERAERYVSRDGRWWDFHVCKVGDGESRRLAVLFQDITARKRAERALRESEARQAFLLRLGDALSPLSEPVAILSAASRILGEHLAADLSCYCEFDQASGVAVVRRAWGRQARALVGEHHMDTFPTIVATLRSGRIFAVENGQADATLSEQERALHATLRICGVAAVPLLKDGELAASFTVFQNTPRRFSLQEIALVRETAERTWAAVARARVEEELRESEARARTLLADATAARREAEAANRAKDEFLATLSHELRTPLAAIFLWAGALRSGSLPLHDLARAIDAIVQSAESQSRLIEDLLDLSRLKSGKLLLAPAPVDVAALVASAADIIRPAAASKQITLSAEIAPGLGTASFDGARLKQVLWNLLSNATKFTQPGGSVTLRARKEAGELVMEVADTGEGITPDFMPHIFERFRQADMRETRRYGGLGIGLALSKQLVELHGGSIEAESAGRDQGSLFRVRLPWVACERAIAAAESADGLRGDELERRLSGVTVLLVEDDANTREALALTLSRAGAMVVPAASGPEALARLRPAAGHSAALEAPAGVEEPQTTTVIVSDLGLPGMSGYQLIEQVVSSYARRGEQPPPACAVSAHARDVDRARAIDAGFDLYLAKPVTPEQLIDTVESLRDIAALHPG